MTTGKVFNKSIICAFILISIPDLQGAGLGSHASAQSQSFSQELSFQEQDEFRAMGLELNIDSELGVADTLVLPNLADEDRVAPSSLFPFPVQDDEGGSIPLNDFPFQVVPGERTEDEIEAMDDPVLRERILRSFSVDSTCNTASSAWFQTLRDLGGNSKRVRFEAILRKAKRTDPARAIRDAAAYDQNCLRRHDTFEPDLQSAGIQQVVGVLNKKDLPRCSALRVAQNLFVTARHCLYDKKTGRENVDIKDLSLSLATDGFKVSYNVLRAQSDQHGTAPIEQTYTTSKDYIYLVSSTVPVNMPAITFQTPNPGAKVTLGGYFRFHRFQDFLANITNPVLDNKWPDGFRLSNSAQCVIGEVSSECGMHYCQSDARFSGSGVFNRKLSSDNELVVSGLHVSSQGRGLGCGFSHMSRTGNVLIAIQ